MKKTLVCMPFVLVLLFVMGCASQEHQPMYSLSVELNKLTATAEGYEYYAKPDPDMDSLEFLKKATEHDPGLLTPFDGYTLKVLRQDGHVSILVCSPDGAQALLQDVGCTNKHDDHIWKQESPCPCVQHGSVFSTCSPEE
ncbi:hypothetical protein [uncultured Pseudodesulfovibrio sp.]|uniref:hypothetical protein n=1 Tax=uncultured Pseudodesulfovibrio sp. TaxID=2035858 RepID=UPI0029C6A997|nr:hypothetical protein [uncultured Pseudodesulfovibrio sp.]